MKNGLSCGETGVDIANVDRARAEMASILEIADKRVLNRIGAFEVAV